MNERRARIWPRPSPWPALADATQFPAHYLVAALAAGCVLIIHLPTVALAVISRVADSSEFSEAILVPLAALWLIWNRRQRLLALTVSPWWPGLLAVAAAAACWVLADFMNINVLRELALVAMLQALVPTVLGLAYARALALPLLLLVLTANVLLPLVAPLTHLTAMSTVAALRLTAVPATLDGLTIVTGFGRWEVIDGCSGVSYLRVYAVAGALFASMATCSTRRGIAIVGASLLAAIVANILREWAIVFLASFPGASEPDHDVIGWLSFAAVFLLLLAVGRRLRDPQRETQDRAVPAPQPQGSARSSAFAALAAVAIAGAAPAAMAAWERHAQSASSFDGCRVLDGATLGHEPGLLPRMRTVCSGPSGRRQLADVAPAIMRAVTAERLVPGMTRIESPEHTGGIDAATLTTLEAKIPYRLTYWYEVGDTATGSWIRLKWHLALALFANRDPQVTVVSELQELDGSH